jgi:hypothetical protein
MTSTSNVPKLRATTPVLPRRRVPAPSPSTSVRLASETPGPTYIWHFPQFGLAIGARPSSGTKWHVTAAFLDDHDDYRAEAAHGICHHHLDGRSRHRPRRELVDPVVLREVIFGLPASRSRRAARIVVADALGLSCNADFPLPPSPKRVKKAEARFPLTTPPVRS